MRLLTTLNLAELRDISLRDDLDADERAAVLLEWHARDLRAGGVISLLLERWVLASPQPEYERFLGLHRLFRPWAGDDEAALACWNWWTHERPAIARRSHGPAWRIVADGDHLSPRRARELRDESAMHRLGYLVGDAHGLPVAARRALLDRFYTEPLPSLVSAHHGDDYGEPASERRLRRMASVMAWNIDRFRRHDPARFGTSVEAWAADLEYLRARWHDGWFGFPWPRVAVDAGADAPLTSPVPVP